VKRTDLIQRLQRLMPHEASAHRRAQPPSRAYRDALLAGPTIPAAIRAMRDALFSFDYMGSAEFECGVIPHALRETAREADHFIAKTLTIKKTEIADRYAHTRSAQPSRDQRVYVLARPDHMNHAEAVIRACAHDGLRLQEATHLPRALCADPECFTAGWLELDNVFWFFTDRVMFRGVCALYGIDPEKRSA